MSFPVDWTDIGIFPLQDHEGVSIGVRQCLVGGRIRSLPDPKLTETPEHLTYAAEQGMGTLGDIHPWLYWQTMSRSVRPMGSWAGMFGGLTMCGGRPRGFGGGASNTEVQPLIGAVDKRTSRPVIVYDTRYMKKAPTWDPALPHLPRGVLVSVVPTTEENSQQETMLYGDPRLFAPNVCGPRGAGTLICDLQPAAEPCMGPPRMGPWPPGYGGRAARLQSMVRVIAMNKPPTGPGYKPGMPAPNFIAWQCTASGDADGDDELWGYGLCWFKGESGQGGPGGPYTGGRAGGQGQGGFGDSGNGGGVGSKPRWANFGHKTCNAPQGQDPLTCLKSGQEAKSIGQYGHYLKHTRSGKIGEGPAGIIAVMSHEKGGPLHPGSDVQGGCMNGKHKLGEDGEGNWIQQGHIDTKALYYGSDTKDGPLFFEDVMDEPPQEYEFPTVVKLQFDVMPFAPGPRDYWKWVSSTWVHTNQGFGGGDVGSTTKDDVKLNIVTHPSLEGFTEIAIRPQLSVKGARSWLHPERNAERKKKLKAVTAEMKAETESDFTARPQVIAMRSWGAQDAATNTWVYNENPKTSRAYGGTADGGILFAPPRQEIEDYFSINSDGDIYDATTMGYVACAPDTAFALGTPNSDGGLNAKSVTIEQSAAAASNHKLLIYQLNSSRVKKALFEGELDQGSGEMIVSLASGGKECIRIPRGTTAERPGTLTLTGGEIRANTTGSETIEFLDPDSDGLGTAAWITLATPRANVFTGHQTLNDNVLLKLGTGGDSTITYDGTNTIWDPKAVGSGYVRLNGKLGFNVAPVEEVHAADTVRADTKFNHNGTDGLTGSIEFYDALGGTQTVTIRGGIITAWTS